MYDLTFIKAMLTSYNNYMIDNENKLKFQIQI